MKQRFPSSFYNPITIIGAGVAIVSFGLILFMIVLEAFAEQHKPYVGILTFIILPSILVLGLLTLALGIAREHMLERKGKAVQHRLPRVDLNDPRHRRAAYFFVTGTILLVGFSAFGSFKAYEYTDSDEFCGEVCHDIMSPEYTAYQFSPHARVGCVQCHIGPGADWFVRAKLSGAYQVYAAAFNKYPRPIPTPIENLRPAQETCEGCHWPKHFFSEKFRVSEYYMPDEENTHFSLSFLVKVGGGNIEAGPTSGIHWHMNIANEVTYAALDTQRQLIPWVRSKSADGKETIYRSTEIDFSEEDLKNTRLRRMDCVDCHNRPTHIYHPPARSVNHVMSLGWIDPKLPSVKSISVQVLDYPYATKANGIDSIRLSVLDFYQTNYPDIAIAKKTEIERTITELQTIYKRSFFPEMKVSWKNFPDQIGHMYTKGCFRCHDGKHVSDDGKVLTKDCNSCHTLLAQRIDTGTQREAVRGVEYQHPVDIGDAWKEMNCSDCHNPN